ncbi:MAG: tryptophan synthase subunit alpha [Gemmatimonadota bacterium]
MGSRSATISSDPSLTSAWADLRQRGRTALIPYCTAGYPDYDASRDMLQAADEYADIIEVGVPFSDPLADGPTIQRSIHSALAKGMTLPRTLELIEQSRMQHPVVVFSYLNPILHYGLTRFLRDASAIGVAGVLLTDLPAGADSAIESELGASSLDLIRLVAPTTSDARLRETVRDARGFIYLIARLGVTGTTAGIDNGLAGSVHRVRAATSLPVAVGFGIADPGQAAQVAGLADGVVVGSALVEQLATSVEAGRVLLHDLRVALDRADGSR